MKEYRLNNLPVGIKEALEAEGVMVFEEEFDMIKTYLIYSEDDLSDVLSSLEITFNVIEQDESGWQERWKDYIKEGYLTDEIYYAYDRKIFDDERRVIYITPGLSFGTGGHATTRLASKNLVDIVAGMDLLDVGTGSGILSIASSMMGAKKIVAFDNDDMSVGNIKINIENNNVKNIINFIGNINAINHKQKYDIVVANIISSVLISLIDDISKLAKKYIVLSGILADEYDNVIKRLTPKGFKVEKRLSEDNWVSVRLIRV